MRKFIFILTTILIFLFLEGCNNAPLPPIEAMITIDGVDDNTWTYFSFDKGGVVGKSDVLSKEDDAKWRGRSDWDIAICGEHIRTNSGTSGNGQGGIAVDQKWDYASVKEAPESGYIIDSKGHIIKK